MISTISNTGDTLCKNVSILFFGLLLLCVAYTPSYAATMQFQTSFDSLSGMKCSGNCPSISNKVGNFSLTRNMKTSYRTEVAIQNGKGTFQFGQEYWLGLNYSYEDWAKDSSADFAPIQVHVTASSWNAECNKFGGAVKVEPFFIKTKNGQVNFVTYGNRTRWSWPVELKKWQNIVVHFKLSKQSDGYIEVWKNGAKLGRVDGANSRVLDTCNKPMQSPYFKMGVYKWDWKTGSPATGSSRRQILIDDVKIANGSNGYTMVSSASAPATEPEPEPVVSAPAASVATVVDADTTPPTLRNIQTAVTDTTAVVTWETNEDADSTVRYGLSKSYGANQNSQLLVTSHRLTLSNLQANKTYHYKVLSRDVSGNTRGSADLTFTTQAASDDEYVVADWTMDAGSGSRIADESGNGHTLRRVNGAKLTKSGVQFDGVNDYLDAGKFNVTGTALSISAWFWSDNLANCKARDCRIISKATGSSEQDHYFMVSTIKSGSATRLRFRLKTNGRTSTLIAASGNVPKKRWVHVAAVYDGRTMRLYQDGVAVGSMAKQGSLTTNSNGRVWIGGNPPSAKDRPWKGLIDEVSIYSYALTASEIADLAK